MYGENTQRIMFIGALICIVLVASFLLYAKNDLQREQSAEAIAGAFHSFKKMEGSSELPSLRLAGPDGQEMGLEDLRGKYVLLNFWAMWCAPCVKELPSLQALKNNYTRPDFAIIAVSVDDPVQMEKIPGFLDRLGVGSVAYYHDYKAQLQTAFAFNALPTTYLISPQGKILYVMAGPTDWYTKQMVSFLDRFQ